MKYLYVKLFKSEVFQRYNRLKEKQAERLRRVLMAVEELYKYQDTNIVELFPVICRILRIKNNKAAKHFIISLVINSSKLEESAKQIPLK